MKRLGYTKFVAQGGDWGDAVTEQMAVAKLRRNCSTPSTPTCPARFPPTLARRLSPVPRPAGLSDEEKHAYDQLAFFYGHGLAYAQEMGNRPQTLYAIADSPVGLAAWILDHDARSEALISRVFDGQSEGLRATISWTTSPSTG